MENLWKQEKTEGRKAKEQLALRSHLVSRLICVNQEPGFPYIISHWTTLDRAIGILGLCKRVWNKVETPVKCQPTEKVGLVQLPFRLQNFRDRRRTLGLCLVKWLAHLLL